MTRINLITPVSLTDAHLIAEIKEINQLSGSFRKSLYSKNGIDVSMIPASYTLNKGHVKFFYNKGKYLEKRFNLLVREARQRGFKIKAEFNNEWLKNNRLDLYNDWASSYSDELIVLERIKLRISQNPDFYRYYGKPIKKPCTNTGF